MGSPRSSSTPATSGARRRSPRPASVTRASASPRTARRIVLPSVDGVVKRWLVSGGVGFIGHHLVRHLVARGDHVRIIDDFSAAPYPTRFKRRNANELASGS